MIKIFLLGSKKTKTQLGKFKKVIPYGRQNISKTDIDTVVEVLKSDFLTQGPAVPKFEESISTYTCASYGVAVNSATSALHIACLALGLSKGDILWTVPNTFVASANCARYCGADVDFVDIDPATYNMCVEGLSIKLKSADKLGKLPKVVIPVHFAGQPCDMVAIHALSQKYGFKIIEDASHAIGASYSGIKVGSCQYSDITVFSFHPVKIITTGEGGAALTNDQSFADRMRRLRTHGITTDHTLMEQRPPNEIWNYQQIELGFNYRMTDIQAALGLGQMNRLDEFVTRRHEIAKIYNEQLSCLPVVTPFQEIDTYSSYHLYPIRVPKNSTPVTQKQVYEHLRKNGVGANLHYISVHRQPYYEKLGFKSGDFPEAEKFHKEVVSLPMFPDLSSADQNKVIKVLTEYLI
jgi:UDP-4-amino-4,6-dideoxy-N-acetyl-beta-L-altrosamine transaminase